MANTTLEYVLGCLRDGVIPGELWEISAYEAHCMLIALERLFPYFTNEDTDYLIWQNTLAVEAQRYALHELREVSTHIALTPFDKDRVFWEVLLKAERARLAEYEPAAPCYDCGRTVYDHENAIREWLEREIELPKGFTLSRRKFNELSFEERWQRKKLLARKDTEKVIEQEVERLKIQFATGDAKALEDADAISQTHETTLNEARKRLSALLEPHIID